LRELRLDIGTGCPLRCPHCDRRAARPRWAAPSAVERALAGLSAGAAVVFTGGDPLFHPDLPALVRAALAAGAGRVLLATTALDRARLRAAVAAGGGRLGGLVWLPSLDPATAALVTGVPDAAARLTAGIDALVSWRVPVTLHVLVTLETARHLAATLDAVARRWPAVRALRLSWPAPGPAPAALEPDLSRAAARAAAHGLALRFGPDRPVAPCLFTDPGALAALFAPPSDAPAAADPACAGCALRDACDGWSERQRALAADAGAAPRPLRDPPTALLALPRRRDEAGAPPGTTVLLHRGGAADAHGAPARPEQVVVRVTARCNQRCRFCWVAHEPVDPPFEEVAAACAAAAALRPRAIALSGGEPTLRPDLVALVERLRAASDARLTLQTNATRLAAGDPPLAARLRAAGLDEVFVSLHAADPDTYARVTGAPVQHLERALRGIDAALSAGLEVLANHVIAAENVSQLSDFAAFLSARFANRVGWNVSFVQAMGVAPADVARSVPRLAEVRPALDAALRLALARGLPVTGLEALCGLPPCALAADLRERFLPADHARADLATHPAFEKGAPCAACALSARCPGLRLETAQRWGFDDVIPIR
jgi:molybdenum cofactor biosynthesis enzyme MoaA